ncbi:Metallo-hydrolase/oxidoreductase [Sanghuangporus baumii]|uniref:Metallo-hydrolase/oxidoreductase n=1 Tax=Sanghuangporus baumii TaxID=108892 RepID=A0A9Q5I1W4_SANBA|nr:Metallo-hydrolase/oxidoreductase [Sanghuangporus baumii]
MVAVSEDYIKVSFQPAAKIEGSGKPSHWKDAKATAFQNPWPSYQDVTFRDVARFFSMKFPPVPQDIDNLIPSVRPTWGKQNSLELPCRIDEVPEIDVIVISHNHYDHCDAETIKAFSKRTRPPHVFAPLGNTDLFRSMGIPKERIHCLDWWEGRHLEVEIDSKPSEGKGCKATVSFDLTCTPSQHQANRGILDRNKSLWGSWVVQEVPPLESERKEGVKVYFAGDTGYRAVREGADEEEVPCCPAFKEIGERFGGFDFAMIPIGAYEPRSFMSRFHVAPQDSVRIFKDIRAKKALGMHWGTWALTSEEVTEPPRKLAEERKKAGIPEDDFDVCKLGETCFF